MKKYYVSSEPTQVKLLDSEIKDRFRLNETLLMKYQAKDLLFSYYFEAGLVDYNWEMPPLGHWGWENPACAVRGHYLGHWLSAAAYSNMIEKNGELIARARFVVDELARCQKENGGQWVAAVPEKVVRWTAQGKNFGVPIYCIHKLIMGLLDMYQYGDAPNALEIACGMADWFVDWTQDMSDDEMDNIMEIEAGGILEEWCRLYEITEDEKYKVLMYKFVRRPLLNAMLQKEDVLTNHHANTTVPEILGIAKMYELTGEERYLEAVKNYWDLAIESRGTFVTGGQTSGEIWTPPMRLKERLGKMTQEHCTVYNLMRVAEYLFQYTGDVKYANFRELNLYNGVLAQQNPNNGHAAYYLPLQTGGKKIWASEKKTFWCCCGSGVQAGASHMLGIYAENEDTIVVNQFIPSVFTSSKWGRKVTVTQKTDLQACNTQALLKEKEGSVGYPDSLIVELEVNATEAKDMKLLIRVPDWRQGKVEILEDGKEICLEEKDGYLEWNCAGQIGKIKVIFNKTLTIHPMEGCPDLIAFRDGPVVLAGLTRKDRLKGDYTKPQDMMHHTDERKWMMWTNRYRTIAEDENIEFMPLNQIADEEYTVYFYHGGR